MLVSIKKALDDSHFLERAERDKFLSSRYMGYLDVTVLGRRLYLDAKSNSNWASANVMRDSKTPRAYKSSPSSDPQANLLKQSFGQGGC
jgi:hypothetical protein